VSSEEIMRIQHISSALRLFLAGTIQHSPFLLPRSNLQRSTHRLSRKIGHFPTLTLCAARVYPYLNTEQIRIICLQILVTRNKKPVARHRALPRIRQPHDAQSGTLHHTTPILFAFSLYTGAGKYPGPGGYTECALVSKGTGQFKPGASANPHVRVLHSSLFV
jgi:hypothetical protein